MHDKTNISGVECPYISVLVTVRCDDWAGASLIGRYQAMINYWYRRQQQYPGIFELCLLEYNPIDDIPIFEKLVNIPIEMDCKIWKLPQNIHQSLSAERDFLGPNGCNLLMRLASGKFLLPTTQDIFLSKHLLEIISNRQLDENCFYRADRLDFINPEPVQFSDLQPKKQDTWAIENAVRIHVRHDNRYNEISFELNPKTSQVALPRTLKNLMDDYNSRLGIIYSRDPVRYKSSLTYKFLNWLCNYSILKNYNWSFIDKIRVMLMDSQNLGLHTNASGDFILASRSAYRVVKGFLETNASSQLHSDSLMVAQLTGWGLKQALFCDDNLVLHTDHERGQVDLEANQTNTWNETYEMFIKIAKSDDSCILNDNSWGFGNFLDKIPRLR